MFTSQGIQMPYVPCNWSLYVTLKDYHTCRLVCQSDLSKVTTSVTLKIRHYYAASLNFEFLNAPWLSQVSLDSTNISSTINDNAGSGRVVQNGCTYHLQHFSQSLHHGRAVTKGRGPGMVP